MRRKFTRNFLCPDSGGACRQASCADGRCARREAETAQISDESRALWKWFLDHSEPAGRNGADTGTC